MPFPHSGEQNHHGSKTAYGGDYEAQRHWMELTLHLPISQWYKYDVSYWGLDYPPLIAYGSYAMGWISSKLVGEESVALFDSRGYEGPVHKAFMRSTVIFWDAFVYFPMVYLIAKRLGQGCHDRTLQICLGAMIQPSLVAIDNGHFQYNNVCLGLALGAFHFMTLADNIGVYDVFGSILFCLALNWKQMTLYYAPAVFAFLLGKCFRQKAGAEVLRSIAILGVAVISTFFTLWFPFYYYRQEPSESVLEVFGPILRRIFPFSRGLFEGKVANFWCVANIKPISIRERIPGNLQPLCALALTLTMMLPFCIPLFIIGRQNSSPAKKLKALLWGSVGTSLAFFLASFQVHEKSILFALAPLSLLDAPMQLAQWFSVCSTWSLWHLLVVDQLHCVYFILLVIYLCFILSKLDYDNEKQIQIPRGRFAKVVQMLYKSFLPLSILLMIILHIAEAFVVPPPALPDIFPVLWVVVGCASFVAMWVASLGMLSTFLSQSKIFNEKED